MGKIILHYDELIKAKPIQYIYGAGIVAASVYRAVSALYGQKPVSFIVSSLEGNPSEIDGISVVEIDKVRKDLQDRLLGTLKNFSIWIALPVVFQKQVKQNLLDIGLENDQIICVDNHLENELMEAYIRTLSELQTADEVLHNIMTERTDMDYMEKDISSVQVFQAKCHVDKSLKTQTKLPSYVVPIQVGASLTEQRICNLQDNVGDNISEKNRNYSELTATYYVWEHCDAEYKGLCHYRRVFDINEEKMQALVAAGVDVILPYPSVHIPSIASQHKRYISDADWQAMCQALAETAHEYFTDLDILLNGQFFYNFNMVIAKREIFDEYCEFLFKVLTRTEELTEPKGWERADRFAGYMGENLTTLFFLKNAARFHIVSTGKLWLV